MRRMLLALTGSAILIATETPVAMAWLFDDAAQPKASTTCQRLNVALHQRFMAYRQARSGPTSMGAAGGVASGGAMGGRAATTYLRVGLRIEPTPRAALQPMQTFRAEQRRIERQMARAGCRG